MHCSFFLRWRSSLILHQIQHNFCSFSRLRSHVFITVVGKKYAHILGWQETVQCKWESVWWSLVWNIEMICLCLIQFGKSSCHGITNILKSRRITKKENLRAWQKHINMLYTLSTIRQKTLNTFVLGYKHKDVLRSLDSDLLLQAFICMNRRGLLLLNPLSE